MSRLSGVLVLLGAVAVLTLQIDPLSAQGRGRALGRDQANGQGRKAVGAEAPPQPGARNGVEAIEALRGELGQRVRERGQDPERVAALIAADSSLWIDDTGQMMFVDPIDHDGTEGPGDPPDAEPPAPTGPPPQPIAVQSNGLPIHHSKPDAPWTIYLDVDGAFVRSAPWGIVGRQTRGLTIDADASTFNAEEQAVISRIWGRVAEDWAPFDVDVTTEQPAAIDASVLWSIVGERPQDMGFGSGVGGVSLFCECYMPFGPQTPTFTFWGAWGATDHSTIADVITQENGHMLGLLHDGLLNPLCFGGFCEYYTGHGTGPTSWGPVMGAPNRRNVTQWSRGEYGNATNGSHDFGIPPNVPLQDDIAIIAGKLGFRADDFGDTILSALPLSLPTVGHITSAAESDVFALPRATDVRIDVTPFRAGELEDGGNLDVAAEILNGDGVVVASIDDPDQTAATLTAILPPGQHYLRVRSSFSPVNYPIYDSLGQYTVTGTFTNTVRMTGFEAPLPAELMTPGRTIPVKFGMTDGASKARVQLWSSASAAEAIVLAETTCRAQVVFRQHCNLKLPKELVAGETYWIVAQFEDLDGQWVTAQMAPASSTANPLAFVAALR
jgi:hypothetical protein